MQADQAGRRVDPELVGEDLADAEVRRERVGLAPLPVEREHQLLPEALPQRMMCQQRLELRDRLRRRPDREQRADPLLLRLQPELVEPRRLREQGSLGDVGERRASPHRQGVIEGVDRHLGVDRQRAPRVAHERVEPSGVDVERIHDQDVAGRSALQDPLTQGLAEVRYVRLERVACLPGGLVAPDLIDQRVGGDDLVRADQEVGENGALLRTAEGHGAISGVDLQRAEQTELHPATVPRLAFIAQGCIVDLVAQDRRKMSVPVGYLMS